MPLNPPGSLAGGGLVSSSAVLVLVVGVLVIFLAHGPIKEWLGSRHSDVREHLYGPEELYEPTSTTTKDPEDVSDSEAGAQADPEDGFDYGIFAQPSPTSQ